MSEELLRPSALPKLAACRCYVGAPGTSAAAERGTKLDGMIRSAWNLGEIAFGELTPDDREAIQFALDALNLLSLNMHVETREEHLKAVVPMPGIKAGTMDALCVAGSWLADFKTGQIRSYTEQMAAYALACMDAYFEEEWNTHLIFVDQKQVVSRSFTREEAEEIVSRVANAPKVETPCEYCSWCGAFETCPAVTGAAVEVTGDELPALTPIAKSRGDLPPSLEGLLHDHARAREFMDKLKIVNDWADVLKKKLLAQLQETPSDYFNRVVVSGSRKVNPLSLGRYITELGFDRVLKICAQIPVSKLEEPWREVFGDRPIPEDIIVTSGGTVSLRTKKLKQKQK